MQKIMILLLMCFGGSLAWSQTPPLNDQEITQVLVTINEGEIDAAQIARRHTKSKEIDTFAKMMIDGHKKNLKDTKAVAKSNDIDAKESEMSRKLKEDAKNSNKALKDKAKEVFDRAYIDQQVDMHQRALDTLQNSLIPTVTNGALKAHLEKTSAEVTQHLSHVKELQTKIK